MVATLVAVKDGTTRLGGVRETEVVERKEPLARKKKMQKKRCL